MQRCDRHWLALLSLVGSLVTLPVQAQVRADDTLPNASRVEGQGRDRITITEGTQVNTSLFHSFVEFSVPRRGQVTFANVPATIDTILTRVTGPSASTIEGVLEVLDAQGNLSTADLFLMNPNGIEFGRNAQLRFNGSFLATTADRILLDEGTLFSARRPAQDPVLTVSTPVGLQFGRNPGTIVNRSFRNSGLQVADGEAIALIGGDIDIPGGFITARSGHITLGSVGALSTVGLTSTNPGWTFNYQAVRTFGDIQLWRFALLDASSPDAATSQGGGRIDLRGDRLRVTGEAAILSETAGNQDGQPITINVTDLEMDQYSLILTNTSRTATAGDVVIQGDRVQLDRGAQIVSLTESEGQAGDVRIQATESIDIRSGFRISDRFDPSGIFSQVIDETVTGDGGEIAIATPRLRILDGGQISTTTFGIGDAGNIDIQAEVVEIQGNALNRDGSLFKDPDANLPIGSGIFSGTEENSVGDGGNLSLAVGRLSVQDGGALQTGTLGAGDAGLLRVQATEAIEISGQDQEGIFPASLFAASGGIPRVTPGAIPDATGRGGDIVLRTDELRVFDGGAIAVGSLNPDPDAARGAGNLRIQAQTVRLENEGRLLAETASGDGGNITLRVAELLLLRHNSQISTTAGTEETGGDGGDIGIDALFILSVLQENNDITANAFEGQGGNVNIVTDSLLGIQFQIAQTPQSDITASSQFGLDGEVVINTLDIDPTQDVVQLPDDILDASRLVRQNCPTSRIISNTPENAFYVTGRGGVPETPSDLRSTGTVRTSWIDLPSDSSPTQAIAPTADSSPIVEAQGWSQTSDGAIALVAHRPSTESPSHPWPFHPVNCP